MAKKGDKPKGSGQKNCERCDGYGLVEGRNRLVRCPKCRGTGSVPR